MCRHIYTVTPNKSLETCTLSFFFGFGFPFPVLKIGIVGGGFIFLGWWGAKVYPKSGPMAQKYHPRAGNVYPPPWSVRAAQLRRLPGAPGWGGWNIP